MKLTSKSEYACLALIELASNYSKDGVIAAKEIARQKHIPRKFLEQILLTLKRGGLVSSRKGSDGGYRLNKAPFEITVAEVIRLMDGALAPVVSVSEYFYEPSPVEQSPELIRLFRDIRDYISDKLEKTTFADLIPGPNENT
jgi:Rrf2 family protein